MRRIEIIAGDIALSATLNESETADAVWEALPVNGSANIWGDEIYFSIPVHLDEAADAQTEVEVGTLAYWPPGNAFCILYGRTPASRGDLPCLASPSNVFGHVEGDATLFCRVQNGEAVRVVRSSDT